MGALLILATTVLLAGLATTLYFGGYRYDDGTAMYFVVGLALGGAGALGLVTLAVIGLFSS